MILKGTSTVKGVDAMLYVQRLARGPINYLGDFCRGTRIVPCVKLVCNV